MKIEIVIDCDNDWFGESDTDKVMRAAELLRGKVIDKMTAQLHRPKSLCSHPEAAYKILDGNRNTVGFVKIET